LYFGPANPNTNTIVCDGNGAVTTQTGATGTVAQQKCYADCIRLHERSHKEDVDVASPGICKGKPVGTQVAFSNEAERKWSERRACLFELRCLKSKIGSSADQNLLKQRIAQMEVVCAGFK
jgi:hypothetical protein